MDDPRTYAKRALDALDAVQSNLAKAVNLSPEGTWVQEASKLGADLHQNREELQRLYGSL